MAGVLGQLQVGGAAPAPALAAAAAVLIQPLEHAVVAVTGAARAAAESAAAFA